MLADQAIRSHPQPRTRHEDGLDNKGPTIPQIVPNTGHLKHARRVKKDPLIETGCKSVA